MGRLNPYRCFQLRTCVNCPFISFHFFVSFLFFFYFPFLCFLISVNIVNPLQVKISGGQIAPHSNLLGWKPSVGHHGNLITLGVMTFSNICGLKVNATHRLSFFYRNIYIAQNTLSSQATNYTINLDYIGIYAHLFWTQSPLSAPCSRSSKERHPVVTTLL